MIKIAMFFLGTLLLVVGWFVFTKAKKAFIFLPELYEEKELNHLNHFFQIYGRIYIFSGIISFFTILINNKFLYGSFLVLISVFTASFSLQLSKKVKVK